jgi:hypothetical protein
VIATNATLSGGGRQRSWGTWWWKWGWQLPSGNKAGPIQIGQFTNQPNGARRPTSHAHARVFAAATTSAGFRSWAAPPLSVVACCRCRLALSIAFRTSTLYLYPDPPPGSGPASSNLQTPERGPWFCALRLSSCVFSLQTLLGVLLDLDPVHYLSQLPALPACHIIQTTGRLLAMEAATADQLRDQRGQGAKYWPPFAPWVQ